MRHPLVIGGNVVQSIQNGTALASLYEQVAVTPDQIRFIDRCDASNAGIPATFMPLATRFAVTEGSGLSYLAHPVGIYGATRKSSWDGGKRERLFETLSFNADCYTLAVREYGDRRAYGELWSVQRSHVIEQVATGGASQRVRVHDVLALDTDPIFWTHVRVAKAMAKLCHPNPRHEARCLHWIAMEGEKRGAQ